MVITDISKVISKTAYKTYEKRLLNEVKNGKIPNHIAITLDGNRRFARKHGLSIEEGHIAGREKLEEVLGWCTDLGIKILSVYAFSTENLSRDSKEVNTLMKIFEDAFRKAGDDKRVHENKIRIKVIGHTNLLPLEVQDAIRYAEGQTKEYDNYFFNLAIAYSGRNEILQAINRIVALVREGSIDVSGIDESVVSSSLYTAGLPDPDLVIRTSGEKRVSNFLLWQIAHSKLCFTDVYWPAFTKIDFLEVIQSYQQDLRDLESSNYYHMVRGGEI